MNDAFHRKINYLRISVTDRCNLRCVYCMPEEGVELINHEEILSLEEIIRVINSAVMAGIRKIRFTGGEPLVRKGISSLIERVNDIPEIDDIALTTNGILLPIMAAELRKAGLRRVNISLDTLVPEKFRRITRGGRLSDAWLGVETALEAGFDPVKINTVVIRGFNEEEVYDFAELTTKMPLNVRFIELMPIGVSDLRDRKSFVSTTELIKILQNRHELVPEKVAGNGPAKSYRIPGAMGTIGFISPISNHFCADCNRLRLTAEGQLRPCLQSPQEIDLKTPLREGASPEQLADVIRFAISSKPEKHNMEQAGWAGNRRWMTQIGG
ncbi:GTP 3',8-cyclase MoaA [Phosphitispora fastidiosa]|uniref:GTP 3',8-cyclase MoaA n=1 Tax=Phosphitispora fastidiosa TaxID=2837202 RepID=UPI001E545179|nr:GTP 3',8-cyclase MoaA [Phosphitispora fastidiosa]MBU7008634.1 cyclic pyranopterin phosphate synthase [Phosphitispora fastidiosa]